MTSQTQPPKVFVSYSHDSDVHKQWVLDLASRLRNNGVDVVLDVWDLNEGDDKYAFMEKTVTDESVTPVLVFSDAEYASKANARKAGVGTESQIISREVYAKVQQSKVYSHIPHPSRRADSNSRPAGRAYAGRCGGPGVS